MLIEKAIHIFTGNNPGFDLQAHPFREQHSWSGLDKDRMLPAFRALQRIYRLYPDVAAAAAVAEQGYTSAHDIAAQPEASFVAAVAPALQAVSPEGAAADRLAAQLWSDARTVSFHTSRLASGTAPHPHNEATHAHNSGLPDFHEGMPDWNRLFGPGYNAQVAEYASIYGAPAYFTDLMRIIGTYITTPSDNRIPAGLGLQERRPDLWQIALDGYATYHELSYLEIANQVMATKLSADLGQDTGQYLATNYYPFSLPLNQPLEKIRMYLQHFGFTLADVYQRFQVDAAQVARESLLLSPEKEALVTGGSGISTATLYGLYADETEDDLSSTRFFETKTGLIPEALESLVYQQLRPQQWTGIHFNGSAAESGSEIFVRDAPSLQVSGSQTLEFWIYLPQVPSGEETVITKNAQGEFDVQISASPDSTGNNIALTYRCGNSSGSNSLSIFDDMQLNTWYHVAVIRDLTANTLTAYGKDGSGNVAGSGSGSLQYLPVSATTSNVYITQQSEDGYYFDGILAEVRLWNRALSHAEIDNNMWRPLSGNEYGLAAYWPLNEGRGNIATDHSPNASNGTLTGDLDSLWAPADDFYFGDYEKNPALLRQLWINNQGTGTGYLTLQRASATAQTGPRIGYSDDSDQWQLVGRFIHMARQTGWAFADLDRILKSIGSKGLQDSDINALSAAGQLISRLQQPADAVCALWSDMKTYGMGAEGASQTLFDRVFNTPVAFYNPNGLPDAAPYHPAGGENPFYHDSALKWDYTDAGGSDVSNGQIRSSLLSTLKLKDTALTLLTAYLEQQGLISGGTLSLTVTNMSLLYRYASLPAWCGLPIEQFLQLLTLTDNPALSSPVKVLEIVDSIQWLKQHSLNIYQIEYLCGAGTLSAGIAQKYLRPDMDAFLSQIAQAAAATLLTPGALAGAGISQTQAETVFAVLSDSGFCDAQGVILNERPITPYNVYQALATGAGATPVSSSALAQKLQQIAADHSIDYNAATDIAVLRTLHVTRALEQCRDAQNNLVLQQLAGLYRTSSQQAAALLAITERQLPSAPLLDTAAGTYLSIPFAAALNPQTFTLSCWLQITLPDNGESWQIIYSTNVHDQGLILTYSDTVGFQLLLPDGISVALPGTVTAGEWCHVLLGIGTVSGGTTPYTWSLNGAVSTGTVPAAYSPATTGPTIIGQSLNGTIVDFRLYDRYIDSRADILKMLGSTAPADLPAQALCAWWPLNTGGDTAVYDWSGQGHDGTLTATASWQWHDYSPRRLLTAATSSDRVQDAYVLLRQLTRMNAWARWFQLSPEEVLLISANPVPFSIPYMRYGFRFRFDQLRNFVTYKKLHADYRLPGPVLLEYFNMPDTASGKVQTLAHAMGWPAGQLSILEQHFTYGDHPLAFPEDYDDFNTVNGVHSLARCFEVSAALGVNVAFLLELRTLSDLSLVTGDAATDNAAWTTYVTAAEGLEHTISAQYAPQDVRTALQPVQDQVQILLRNVMSSLLIWELGATIAGIDTQQDLYEYLLIDVRMTNAVQMSVLKAGLNSLQLYIQRCLSGMENGVNCTLPKEWWAWMGSYREWEANREVYVYPENYVDPTLRKMQTPLFKSLVSEVKQQPATEESVTKAYLNYLDGLKDIANLHIVDSYARPLPATPENKAGRMIDVFGRTLTHPVTYYHRKAIVTDPSAGQVSWTPWQDTGLTINSAYVTSVYAFGKLFLFWVQQSEESTSKGSDTYNYIRGTLCYSFEKAGSGWVTPQVLTDDIIIKTFNASGAVNDFYYKFNLNGFNPMSPYEQSRAWNKVTATQVPATGDQEEKILITFGDVVTYVNDPNYTFTPVDKPETAEQERAYAYLQNVADLTLPHTGKGLVTTVVPAYLLDAGLRWEAQIPLIDLEAGAFYNGFLVPGDGQESVGILPTAGATALAGESGKVEAAIWQTPGNNLYHSWYGVEGTMSGTRTTIPGPDGESITCLNYNQSTQTEIILYLAKDQPWMHNEFSIGLWVKLNSLSAQQSILECTDYSSSTAYKGSWLSFSVEVSGAFTYRIYVNTSGCVDVNVRVTDMQAGNWYYVSVINAPDQIAMNIYDPSTGSWYENSQMLSAGTAYAIPHNNINLGAYYPTSGAPIYPLNGAITGLRVFDRAINSGGFWNMIAGADSPFRALGSVPAGRSEVVLINNQPGWFLLNAGRESFLAVSGNTGYDPISTRIRLSYGQYLSVSLALNSTAPQTDVPYYHFLRTSTNVIDGLLEKVFAGGVGELLQPSSQRLPEPDFSRYSPNAAVVKTPYPLLDFNGAYGPYFWELFFHIPFYIAGQLQHNLKFPAAKKWYEYVFDPNVPPQTDRALNAYAEWMEKPIATWLLDTPPANGVMPSFPDHYSAHVSGSLHTELRTGLPFSLQPRMINYFQGSDGYLSIPYDAALNGDSFTVSLWFCLKEDLPDDNGTYTDNLISSAGSGTGYNIDLYRYPGEATTILVYLYFNGSSTEHQCIYTVTAGNWYQVIFSVSTTAFTINISGPEVASYSHNQSLAQACAINTTANMTIGSSATAYIANVSYWDFALSAAQMTRLQKNIGGHIPTDPLSADRFWRFLPFRHRTYDSLYDELTVIPSGQYLLYEYDPFDPDAIASQRPGAYAKGIFLRYISNLIAYGDNLFTQDTWESITGATMYYVLASDLLGRPPRQSATEKQHSPATYNQVGAGPSGVPPFLIDLETMPSPAGAAALTARQKEALEQRWSIFSAYFGIPENKQLLTYKGTIEDRLYKIRHGLNINGQTNTIPLFEPPVNPADAAAAAGPGGAGAGSISSASPAVPYYRFSYLIDLARSFASQVISLGNELLAALEKQDAEYLSLLRETQSNAVLALMTQIKQDQVNELYAQQSNLQAALANAQLEQQTYSQWISDGWNSYEIGQLSMLGIATDQMAAATLVTLTSSAMYLLPNIFGLADGGMNFGGSLESIGQAARVDAELCNAIAGMLGIKGNFERMNDQWSLQRNLAQNSITSINAQLQSNALSISAAEQDYSINQTQIQQSGQVISFLQTKFSNEALYEWIAGQVSDVYYQSYQLAVGLAQMAQTAYQYELSQTDTYIDTSSWSDQYKGLQAGDALMLSINQLAQAYIRQNVRSLEISRTISLARLDPKALLNLKQQGTCQFQLTEYLFDTDFPGHYNRKIKNISITVPAVVGPYQNIKATLTQTANAVVTKANVQAVSYLLGASLAMPADGSVRMNWNPGQAIALSSGNADNGLFQLNFNDERYLPFENTGAVSSWQLDMPRAANQFDFHTINDVIIELKYCATDGGSNFKSQVLNIKNTGDQAILQQYNGSQLLSLRQQYGDAWQQFLLTEQMSVDLVRRMYPPNLASVMLVPGSNTPVVLIPVLSDQSLLADITGIALSGNDWDSGTGDIVFPGQVAVAAGTPVRWPLAATIASGSALLTPDGTIDPKKWLDILLVIPYDGTLDWS